MYLPSPAITAAITTGRVSKFAHVSRDTDNTLIMSPPTKRLEIPALHEFRFELEIGEALSVTLLQGSAEVFGMELVPGQSHPFSDEVRAAIWSPNGAEVEISLVFILMSSLLLLFCCFLLFLSVRLEQFTLL